MGRFSKLEFDEKNSGKNLLDQDVSIEEGYNQEYYFNQANEYYRNGDFEKALRYYSRALGIDHLMSSAWVGQIRVLIDLHEHREAHVWVNKALEIFPNHPELLSCKAVVYARLGQIKEAVVNSDLAVEQKDLTAYVWFARGQVFIMKRGRNAEFCFQKALEASKNDWFMLQQIGLVYMEKKQYSKAMIYFTESASQHTSNPYLWYQMGNCSQKLGFTNKAIQYYQQALDLDPRYKPADKALAKAKQTNIISRLFRWLFSN